MSEMEIFEAMSRADYDNMLLNGRKFMKDFLELAVVLRPDVLSSSDDVAIMEISILTVALAMQQNMIVSDALGTACTAYIIKLRNQ